MKSKLIHLYRRLIRLRLVEETIAQEYPKQKIRCPMHLCLGQEAISVGAAAALTRQDALFGTHRSHGPYVASGGNLNAMFLELYGKSGGCCNGRGGSMHLMDLNAGFFGAIPIVGSTLPIATGVAFAFQMQNKPLVSMIIFGEGATEEGVFHESIQFAVFKKLPVIFVCENNGFSVNTPLEERRPKNLILHELAKAHGANTYSGDGNDVLSIYHACVEAVERARLGEGPSFLEFDTYRWMEHCGPYDDHHLPCRSQEKFDHWKKRDPVLLAEKTLVEHGISLQELEQIKNEEYENILRALQNAQEAPFPKLETALNGVYAECKGNI